MELGHSYSKAWGVFCLCSWVCISEASPKANIEQYNSPTCLSVALLHIDPVSFLHFGAFSVISFLFNSPLLPLSVNLSSSPLHLTPPHLPTSSLTHWPLTRTPDSVEYTPSFNPIALKDSALSTHKPIEVKGPGGKATIVHAQYNTPISMYSQDAIMDAIAGQSQAKGHDRWGHTTKLIPSPVFYALSPLTHLTSHHTDQTGSHVEKLKGRFIQITKKQTFSLTANSGISLCRQLWFHLLRFRDIHPNIMEVKGILFALLVVLRKEIQQHVFPKTLSCLLWKIHRTHSQQFSFKTTFYQRYSPHKNVYVSVDLLSKGQFLYRRC